jgi:hypothetical protein
MSRTASLRPLVQGPLSVTAVENDLLATVDIERLLAIERATVERG